MKTKTRKKLIATDLACEANKLLLGLPTDQARRIFLKVITDWICVGCGSVIGNRCCGCLEKQACLKR